MPGWGECICAGRCTNQSTRAALIPHFDLLGQQRPRNKVLLVFQCCAHQSRQWNIFGRFFQLLQLAWTGGCIPSLRWIAGKCKSQFFWVPSYIFRSEGEDIVSFSILSKKLFCWSEFALSELWLERLLEAWRRGWKRLGDRTFSFSNFFSFLLLSNVTIASSIYAEKNKLSTFCKMLLSRPGAILYISLSVLQYKSSPDHSILETSPMGGNHYSILEAGGHPPFNPGLNSLFLAPTPPTGAI